MAKSSKAKAPAAAQLDERAPDAAEAEAFGPPAPAQDAPASDPAPEQNETEMNAQAPAPAVLASPAPMPFAELLSKLAQGVALSPAETLALSSPDGLAALQAALAKRAGGGGGRKPVEAPAFASISPAEAAALKPAVRSAYLESAPEGFSFALPLVAPDLAENIAAMIAKRIGSAVVLRCQGADIMAIQPDHGQAERATKGEREGDKPTAKQERMIALATREGLGATGPELMAALKLTTPHTWPPAFRAIERFGFKLATSKRQDGYASYILEPQTEAAAEMAATFRAREAETAPAEG